MMEHTTDELEFLNACMDAIVRQKPHLATLVTAFRPLFLEKVRLLQGMGDQRQTFPLEPLKFQGGIALGRQFSLFLAHDPWKEIAIPVAQAIAQGFPALGDEMRLLQEQIETGVVDCSHFFLDSSNEEDEPRLMRWAVQCSVSTAALGLFLKSVERILLGKRAADMREGMESLGWDKGYCPVCASLPMLAIIREQGQQWLQCSRCSHEWQFARMTCPACQHKTPEETTYLFIEGNPDEKAFVCEKCRHYLITLNQAGNLQRQCPEVLALSVADLDLILQEKGYDQLALCEWNSL